MNKGKEKKWSWKLLLTKKRKYYERANHVTSPFKNVNLVKSKEVTAFSFLYDLFPLDYSDLCEIYRYWFLPTK